MRWVMLFAVGLAGLALAGCGGGSNNASSNTTTETTTTTAAETTTSAHTTTSGGTTTSDLSNVPNFTSGKCKDLAASAAKISQDFSAAGAGTGNLDNVAKEFQAFADAAPSEIKGDLETIGTALSSYAKALHGVDLSSGQTPSAGDLQKVQAALSKLDTQKLEAAEQHLEAWTQKNCA
jgi:hypothetical protein